MSPLTRVSMLAVAALAIAAGSHAGPCPPLSDVPSAITLSPGTLYDGNPIGTFVVHIEDQFGAVNGALVEVEVSEDADVLIAWCAAPFNQVHPLLTTLSDPNGDATFTFFGGGCVSYDDFFGASFIAQVRADGIVIGEPAITSPDAVNSVGLTATETEANNCENGETLAGLADAVFHTGPIKLGLEELCSKYTPPFDDPVGLDDAVFVTPYIKNSNFCICQ